MTASGGSGCTITWTRALLMLVSGPMGALLGACAVGTGAGSTGDGVGSARSSATPGVKGVITVDRGCPTLPVGATFPTSPASARVTASDAQTGAQAVKVTDEEMAQQLLD